MQRGEIRLVNFEPASDGEANKTRPGILVSNNGANESAATFGRGVVTVVPVTSNVERIHPFQVFLPAEETGLHQDSKAQAEQIRSLSVDRVGRKISTVPPALMKAVDEALRVHLFL